MTASVIQIRWETPNSLPPAILGESARKRPHGTSAGEQQGRTPGDAHPAQRRDKAIGLAYAAQADHRDRVACHRRPVSSALGLRWVEQLVEPRGVHRGLVDDHRARVERRRGLAAVHGRRRFHHSLVPVLMSPDGMARVVRQPGINYNNRSIIIDC